MLVAVVAGLGNPQGDLTDASLESLRLESVGVALTVAGSLTRLGLEHLLSLDLHRLVHERGEGGGHGGRTVLDEQGREAVDHRTFILVGHRRFLLGGVRHFQENPNGPPLQLGPPVRAFFRLACGRLGQARTAILRNVALAGAARCSLTPCPLDSSSR